MSINDDADTTGAFYESIFRPHYGADGIPASCRNTLTMATKLTSFVDHRHNQGAPGHLMAPSGPGEREPGHR